MAEGRQKSTSAGADCGEIEAASTEPVDKAGNALSGLSCDRVERIWRHQCTQASKRGGREKNGEAVAAKPPRRSRWAGGPWEGSGPVHCVGDGGGLDSENAGAEPGTLNHARGAWEGEADVVTGARHRGIAQERSDSTRNGSGAKERRTSSLIFGDALEQPGGCRVGRERRERGMGARRGGESGTSRETSAEASEAKNEQQAALFVGREKNQKRASRPGPKDRTRGRSEGRPAAG